MKGSSRVNPDEVMKSIEAMAPARGFPIIGPRRGMLLDEVVMKHAPSSVLEVGTLVGYSAIRMARLMRPGQVVTCVEVSGPMADVARSNISSAGLSDRVQMLVGDAKEVLPRLQTGFDMVFLDADKSEYIIYLQAVERLLHPGSVVVADNVKSRSTELRRYLDYVRDSGKYASTYHEAPSNYGHDLGDAVEISVRL
jgi:predicted O-methyltransferase YrrM